MTPSVLAHQVRPPLYVPSLLWLLLAIALTLVCVWWTARVGPGNCVAMIRAVKRHIPLDSIAVHFHNTYAMALPNMLAALQVCTEHCLLEDHSCGLVRRVTPS